MDDNLTPLQPPPRGAIGTRAAAILYILLAAAAVISLKGTFLYFTLLIILALAVKSYVHYLRSRLD